MAFVDLFGTKINCSLMFLREFRNSFNGRKKYFYLNWNKVKLMGLGDIGICEIKLIFGSPEGPTAVGKLDFRSLRRAKAQYKKNEHLKPRKTYSPKCGAD